MDQVPSEKLRTQEQEVDLGFFSFSLISSMSICFLFGFLGFIVVGVALVVHCLAGNLFVHVNQWNEFVLLRYWNGNLAGNTGERGLYLIVTLLLSIGKPGIIHEIKRDGHQGSCHSRRHRWEMHGNGYIRLFICCFTWIRDTIDVYLGQSFNKIKYGFMWGFNNLVVVQWKFGLDIMMFAKIGSHGQMLWFGIGSYILDHFVEVSMEYKEKMISHWVDWRYPDIIKSVYLGSRELH